MNKKIMIIAGVVVVILAVGGALIFGNKDDSKSANNAQSGNSASSTDTPTDSSEDLGACKAVEKAAITSAVGAIATGLQDGQDSGVIGLGDGDKGQTCVYPFAEGATVTNSFYVDIASYASQETFNEVKDLDTDGTVVPGIGDKAVFKTSDAYTVSSSESVLTVNKDKKIYKFVISQPAEAATLDAAAAQAALVKLATNAKF